MFPTRNDAYQCVADIENLGYVRVFDTNGTHAPDQENIVVSQFGLEGRRTKSAEFLSVSRIFTGCAPFKVSEGIIGFDRINMVDKWETFRIWDECDRDEPMNIEGRSFPALGQNYSRISLDLDQHYSSDPTLCMPIGVNDLTRNTSDAAKVANFVEPFVSNDGSPFFSDSDIHVTGYPSEYDGSMIKDPSHAPTSDGSAIMASTSITYNRRLRFR
jgi:hypothetical protein